MRHSSKFVGGKEKSFSISACDNWLGTFCIRRGEYKNFVGSSLIKPSIKRNLKKHFTASILRNTLAGASDFSAFNEYTKLSKSSWVTAVSSFL